MTLFNKFLGIFLTTQVCIWVVQGGCQNAPPTVIGALLTTVLPNETVVYKCDGGKEFSSGDTVIVSDCTNNGWYTVTATCSSNNPAITTCDTAPTEEPPDATYKTNTEAGWTNLIRVYECSASKSWLSGRPIKVMPCRKGAWMKVYDICDDGCPVPRDCADVADLGLEDPGQYLVIPSGKSDGKIHSVYCVLNDTDENHGGNWTYIFRQSKNASNYKASEYIFGYGNVERFNGNYFIGLEFLAEISQDFIDRDVGQIMDILFFDDSKDLKYYVTYSNFTVGTSADRFKLFSVGADHGTAGDAMCPLVNTNFDLGDNTTGTAQWWASKQYDATVKNMRGNFLTSNMAWVPLETKMAEIDFVEIRIRPIHKDRAVLCPPMFGSDVIWKETNSSIPYVRKLGTVIWWECYGDLFYEGMEGGERTKGGSITCEQTPNGPQWSKNITLPCTVKCPDGFMLLDDGLRCFNFSIKPANNFIDATLQCQNMNSTLAVINGSTDVIQADATTSYFVNHAKRGTEQAALEFPLDTNAYNCTLDKICEPTPEDACTLVNNSVQYEHTSCHDPHSYICEIPVHCPFNYKLYGYTCYYVASGHTFQEAYAECAKNGSSLAYPPDNMVAMALEDTLLEDFGLINGNHEFFLGVNNWQGIWDYGDFKMDAEFKSKLSDGAADKWRILSFGSSVNYTAVDITYQAASPSSIHALCQYPGPIACRSDPVNQTDYMNRTWDGDKAIGTTILYQCWEGYFVHQNISLSNQTTECLGMLAEWYPLLLDCERTPVCNNSLPNVTVGTVENETNSESYYIGGNISYACPEGMGFPDGNTTLTVFCLKTDQGYQYNVMNIPPCSVCSEEVFIENTTTSWSNTTTYETGSYVILSCRTGFQYLTGAASQNVTCTPEGWEYQSNETCYPMCSGELSYGNATSTWANGTYTSVGSSGELECDTGFQYLSGESKQNVTCSRNGWETSDIDSCVPMCSGEERVEGNAVSTWDNGSYYFIGEVSAMECHLSYEYAPGMTTQNVTCTQTGWNMSTLQPCYSVCEGDPPTPGSNVKPFNVTSRKNGTTLTYECQAGYFEPYEPNAKPSPNITIKCNETGHWENPLGTDYYNCTELCLDDPPATPQNGTSDWDNLSYNKDTAVKYTCDPGHFFGNYSSTWIVTCNGMSWEPLDPANFNCSRVCDTDPPPKGTNEEFEWTAPYGLVGQVLQYNCSNFTANKDGNKSYTITCQDSGAWTSRPADFLCEPGCGDTAVVAPAGVTTNRSNDYREGTLVWYTCPTKFMQYYISTLDNTCSGGFWSLTEIPDCQGSSTTPSTPNANSPNPDAPYESHYRLTSDYYYSEMADEFVSTSGKPLASVSGPFGFGSAVDLTGDDECIKKTNFVLDSDTCLIHPKHCDDAPGFSASLWVYHEVHNNILESVNLVDDPSLYQYALSTGGDTSGHPGFVIAFQEHWLIAIVSTGAQYWKNRVLGQVNASTWNNIGFVWNKNMLKLYVNLKLVATAGVKDSGADLLGLYPHELIIGCHRDNNNKEYRGHLKGMFDEVAIWKKPLDDSPENFEIIKFFGGLDQNKTFATSEKLMQMLQNVNFKDPEQAKIAAETMQLFFAKPDSTQASPTAGTTGASSNSSFFNATIDPASVQELKMKVDMIRLFMDPARTANIIDKDGLEMYMSVMTLVPLIFSKDLTNIWYALIEETGGSDAYEPAKLMYSFTKYQVEMARRTTFPNGSNPFCIYSPPGTDLFSTICKVGLEDFTGGGNRFVVPNYQDGKTSELLSDWDKPFDKIRYFTGLYLDNRCYSRGVSIVFSLFDSVPLFATNRLIKTSSTSKMGVHKFDSRIAAFSVQVDPARKPSGMVDTNKPRCDADPHLMQSHRIQALLEHFAKMKPVKRQLLFHEKENYTNILVRRCVRWNDTYQPDDENVTGAWDTSGGKSVETDADYTECRYTTYGHYGVIAEETEPVVVPADPEWLIIVIFALYAISGLAIIIYMVVVILSGELKDQLHMMGLNLALAILLGSAAMMISLFDPIRVDRHICFGIGTLIHFFYSAVGIWMFCIGHASFKAITAGIVDGRFRAYMFICWGTPLFLTGMPYVMYLHDMGYDPRCFIGWYNKIKYIFFGPQLACAAFAIFWAIVILTNLSAHALRKRNLFKDYGSFCGGAAVLLIYLAVTWGVGFVAYVRFDFKEPNFYPFFQIMNSLSGIFLLICIGFASNRFRRFVCRSKKYDDDDDYDKRNLISERPPEPQPDDVATMMREKGT